MIQLFLNMAYTFLVVSYLASAVSEALASLFGWRGAMLLRAVQAMLNDNRTRLAQAVYASPLVDPRRSAQDQIPVRSFAFGPSLPSYIDPKAFAIVLLQSLGLTDGKIFIGKTPDEVSQLVARLPGLENDRPLQDFVSYTVIRNGGDLELVSASIAAWFENGMARTGGAYKRRIQFSNFCIGLAIAILFNIHPLPPASTVRVHADQATPAAVIGASPSATPTAPTSPAPGSGGFPSSSVSPSRPGSGIPATDRLGSTLLRSAPVLALTTVVGWLLTAFSTLLGAPFWFELIAKINPTNPPGKGAGPRPSAIPGPAAPAPTPILGPDDTAAFREAAVPPPAPEDSAPAAPITPPSSNTA